MTQSSKSTLAAIAREVIKQRHLVRSVSTERLIALIASGRNVAKTPYGRAVLAALEAELVSRGEKL